MIPLIVNEGGIYKATDQGWALLTGLPVEQIRRDLESVNFPQHLTNAYMDRTAIVLAESGSDDVATVLGYYAYHERRAAVVAVSGGVFLFGPSEIKTLTARWGAMDLMQLLVFATAEAELYALADAGAEMTDD